MPPPAEPRDIRSSRRDLLSRGSLVGAARRLISILMLVVLDVAGLALGLMFALVIRTVLYGDVIYWSLLWRTGPAEWLPFLAPVTVLVFLRGGLYSVRERRAGWGRVVSSLILVALIVLAFGLGTNYEFTTTGLIPTAVVTCALSIGVLRAAYESASLELLKAAGIKRRAVLVGAGESLWRLQRELSNSRGGVGYDLVGAVAPAGEPGLPILGESLEDLPAILAAVRPDELILTETDFDERAVLDVVEHAHRYGVRVRLAPDTTELLVREGEYVPGQGVPMFELRPPILAGWDWLVKRAFDLLVSLVLIVIGLPLWLLIALALKLDSRGPVFYVDRRVGVGEREFGMLKFRTMVVGAAQQQPQLEGDNEASGALFKIRDDPRVTRVGRVLRRLSIDELPQMLNVVAWADESRGAAAATATRLRAARGLASRSLPGASRHDRAVADLGPLGPLVRRSRSARFHVPRALVALARHHDHREDDPGRARRSRSLLTTVRARRAPIQSPP